MAKEYIEREDAKRAIQRALNDGTGYGEALNALPAADVVEVVRCKDCKNDGNIICPWWKEEPRPDDFFCANGERRADDG